MENPQNGTAEPGPSTILTQIKPSLAKEEEKKNSAPQGLKIIFPVGTRGDDQFFGLGGKSKEIFKFFGALRVPSRNIKLCKIESSISYVKFNGFVVPDSAFYRREARRY